jgi:hypothetical protein
VQHARAVQQPGLKSSAGTKLNASPWEGESQPRDHRESPSRLVLRSGPPLGLRGTATQSAHSHAPVSLTVRSRPKPKEPAKSRRARQVSQRALVAPAVPASRVTALSVRRTAIRVYVELNRVILARRAPQRLTHPGLSRPDRPGRAPKCPGQLRSLRSLDRASELPSKSILSCPARPSHWQVNLIGQPRSSKSAALYFHG